MVANIHPVTGIAFGVINANSIDGDMLHHISFENGIDALSIDRLANFAITYGFENINVIDNETGYQYYKRLETAAIAFINEKCEESEETTEEYESFCEEEFTGHIWHCDSHGVSTLYNTDDNIIMVLQSTETAMVNPCSPCYPNAGDLDTPNADGIQAYTVPFTWKYSID